jgi:N-dimethylarginine dimethylaminohydrolase
MTSNQLAVADEIRFNGHSMVGELRRVMVCSPRMAGWDQSKCAERWGELGFHHEPDFVSAEAAHTKMRRELESAGAEVVEMQPAQELSLDAVYAHDPSLPTDFGLILMQMGKANRVAEGRLHGLYANEIGIPTLGEIRSPGTAEAGDMVWLDAKTLLIGRGYRTNAEGIQQMTALLAPKGVKVVSAPLPHGYGPDVCLHLMSIMSMLDERTVLVDLSWLAVETVELLESRGFTLVEIDTSERDTLACNVLALGGKRLLALEENHKTNDRLRRAGFDLRSFPGTELCINGGGGPTCLTRPLLRG